MIKYNIILKLSVCYSTCVFDTYVELTFFFSTTKKPELFQHITFNYYCVISITIVVVIIIIVVFIIIITDLIMASHKPVLQ